MKKTILLFFWMLMTMGLIHAQNIVNDVFVIKPAEQDGNIDQVSQRYHANLDALYLDASDPNPLETVSGFLLNKPCNILHLYVNYHEGALIFGDFHLTTANIAGYQATLAKWNEQVSDKILIHCLALAENGSIPMVVEQLGSLSGITVQIIRSY